MYYYTCRYFLIGFHQFSVLSKLLYRYFKCIPIIHNNEQFVDSIFTQEEENIFKFFALVTRQSAEFHHSTHNTSKRRTECYAECNVDFRHSTGNLRLHFKTLFLKFPLPILPCTIFSFTS